MSSTSIIALVAALSAPSLLLAQTVDVSPVVVTATLIPTPIDQVGSSITLITAQDIQDHQWRTVPDALQEVPGVDVVQSGGPGGQTSVFIRGANSNHTKVLIDGIEANDPSTPGDGFDFGQALTGGLARIEVLRGPQSSLYGSDALGGVINIVTRQGQGAPRLDATVEGGSFDTFNQSAVMSGSEKRLSYAFSVDHVHVGATPVTPLDLLAPGETRNDDRYDNLTLGTKLGVDLNSVVGFSLVARYVDSDLKFTSENYDLYPAPDIPDAAQTDQKERQVFARGEARVNLFDGRFANVFGLGYTDYHTRTASPDDGFGASTSFSDGDRLKFDWRGTLALSKTETLVLGAEDRRDRIFGQNDARDSERAGYAELQSHPFANFSGAISVRYDADDRFGDKLTWRIAPAYTIAATGTLLKASYGTGFKAPTLTQLFVSFPPYYLANPNLRPEESEGYDAGFEQPLFGNALRFGVTGFHDAIRNLITDNADFTTDINIGRATTYGAESFIAVAPMRQVSLRVDYTYLVARDDIAQQELLRRPKTKIDFTAVWRPTDQLTLSATGLYVGARVDGNRDFSIPRLTAGPYATFGVAGEYAVTKILTVFARIDNLADRKYEDPVGFQRPGIGAFGGVRASLGG
jgi:vitamin B12 transporter